MRPRSFRLVPRAALFTGALLLALPAAGLLAQQAPMGRITGRVIDRATGRPVTGARVMIVGIQGVVEADLDGRYRTPAIPVGVVSVRAAYIGYTPQQVDSVRLIANQAVTVDFALSAAAVELAEIAVESQIPRTQASDAGLLAMQQAAPAASDGISAEAIKKTPDSDAGDAVTRVTGVTVVDGKQAVVRGLGERYTNTLVNGVETASPEPLKRTVPLDIFAASLLESIVTTKTATPDRPGDFAGGSLEIKTKDFPENFGGSVRVSQKFNSEATFQSAVIGPRSTSDFFGFDNGRRDAPRVFPLLSDNASPFYGSEQAIRAERFGEGIRNVWSPRPQTARPELGLGFNIGGQVGAGSSTPLGYLASVSYKSGTSVIRDRLYRLPGGPGLENPVENRSDQDETAVDWGGIANIALRLGAGTKIAFKNFYTRGAEESFIRANSYVPDLGLAASGRIWQARYIEKSTLQTQLGGEHSIGFLGNTRLEWKATYSKADRDEPENRYLRFVVTPSGLTLDPNNNLFQFRYLTDVSKIGQADLGVPLTRNVYFKVGGLYRDRSRDFRARLIRTSGLVSPPPITLPANLTPEQAFSPELIGTVLSFKNGGVGANSYAADDDLTALYAMADLGPVSWLRIVGGLRVEDWRLNVFVPDRTASIDPFRRNRDYLWSSNLTLLLSDRVNLRLAGFRSVVRPDARELTPEVYFPVGGECGLIGNPRVQRAIALNGDAKIEFFPSVGELISISGYYKRITRPLLTAIGSSATGCRVGFINGASAIVYGGEFEVRKRLVGGLSANLNFSYVYSQATLDSSFSFAAARVVKPPLQGQSPYILNAGVNYDNPGLRLGIAVLFNYFADRVYQYGVIGISGSTVTPAADQIEEARGTLDVKVTKGVGPFGISVSGRNLTNEPFLVTQKVVGEVIPVVQYRRGYDLSLGVSYDF